MKKISLLLLATAAMLYTSCSEDDNQTGNGQGIRMTVTADAAGADQNTRTQIDKEGDKTIAVWSPNDCIFATSFTDNRHIKFERTDGNEVAKTATFRNIEGLKAGTKYRFVYSGTLTDLPEKNPSEVFRFIDENTLHYTLDSNKDYEYKLPTSTISNDLLVSDEVTPTESACNINFHRINSVLRFNLLENVESQAILKNDLVIDLVLTVNGVKVTGQADYNLATGETKVTDGSSRIHFSTSKINLNDPVYFSLLPCTIPEGTIINIKINSQAVLYIDQDVVVGAGGLNLKPGEITTINLNLKVDEIYNYYAQNDPKPDPAKDPAFENGLITMKEPGRLTYKMLQQWIPQSGNAINIKGDINAFDIYSIKQALNKDSKINASNITLNLADANIVTGGGLFTESFSAGSGAPSKIIGFVRKDNCLPKHFISENDHKVGNIILPNSLTEIEEHAIWSDSDKSENREIHIGKNITKINPVFIRRVKPIIYLASPSSQINEEDFNRAFNGSSNIKLYLHKSWKDLLLRENTGEKSAIKGKNYNRVCLMEDDGTLVETIFHNPGYTDLKTGSYIINLTEPGMLTAYMIKKALKNDGVKIVGKMGGSDISGLKTYLRGETGCNALTNVDLSEVEFVDDNSVYEGLDQYGYELYHALPNTVNTYFIDGTNKFIGNLVLPTNTTEIKHMAISGPNDRTTEHKVVIGENITTTAKSIVCGLTKWHVVFKTPKSRGTNILSDTFLIHWYGGGIILDASWKDDIGENEDGEKTFLYGNFDFVEFLNPGSDTPGIGAGDVIDGGEIDI